MHFGNGDKPNCQSDAVTTMPTRHEMLLALVFLHRRPTVLSVVCLSVCLYVCPCVSVSVSVGLGVLLVVIVLLTWRYAQPGYEPCHSLFNISSTASSADPSNNAQSNHSHWHGGLCLFQSLSLSLSLSLYVSL